MDFDVSMKNYMTGGASVMDSGVNLGFGIWDRVENSKRYREQMEREDTAVQRRVADLKAAGLSPTLAAGSGANSSGYAQSTPGVSTNFTRAMENIIADEQLKSLELENEGKEIENQNSIISGEKAQAEIDAIKMQNAFTESKIILSGDTHQLNQLTIEQQGLVMDKLQAEIDHIKKQDLHISYQDGLILQQIENLRVDKSYTQARVAWQNLANDSKSIENEYLREQIETALATAISESWISSMEANYINKTGFRLGTGGNIGAIAGLANNLVNFGSGLYNRLAGK